MPSYDGLFKILIAIRLGHSSPGDELLLCVFLEVCCWEAMIEVNMRVLTDNIAGLERHQCPLIELAHC
jgi:hypothetical protein